MSHLVIYDSDGTDRYERFIAIDEALALIERLRNEGDESARLYRLEEVQLEVKAYYRVEIGTPASTAVAVQHEPAHDARLDASAPAEPAVTDDIEPMPVEAAIEETPLEDEQPTVVEDAPQPSYEEYAVSSSLGGARRGLFGR